MENVDKQLSFPVHFVHGNLLFIRPGFVRANFIYGRLSPNDPDIVSPARFQPLVAGEIPDGSR